MLCMGDLKALLGDGHRLPHPPGGTPRKTRSSGRAHAADPGPQPRARPRALAAPPTPLHFAGGNGWIETHPVVLQRVQGTVRSPTYGFSPMPHSASGSPHNTRGVWPRAGRLPPSPRVSRRHTRAGTTAHHAVHSKAVRAQVHAHVVGDLRRSWCACVCVFVWA